tara:strand:- start:877 stop:1188 length:312 start_codon:yes stop_codon:yes gene_type:complete
MAYIPWWDRMAQEKAEREVKKKAPTKQGLKDLNIVNKVSEENDIKPRFQYDPISEEIQDVNAPGWAEKATKQMEDIGKKPLVVKQTKPPELSGVDRYILAKKI